MKKRKLLLTLFLVLAVALIGLGYSVLSKELKISGNVKGSKNNDSLAVHYVAGSFTSIVNDEVEDAVKVTATPSITSDLIANIVVEGMNVIGDSATVYFLVQNDSAHTDALDATLSNPVVTITTSVIGGAKDKNDAPNIFEGEHYKVTVTYETTNGETPATGTVDASANTAFLAADGTGKNVWIKVVIELVDAITVDDFPQHNIQVLLDARTQ